MGKFQSSLVKEIESQREFDSQQSKLKEKHNIADEHIVVVEKDNMSKFMVRTVGNLVRLAATVVLLVLATIGLLTLVYPELRTPFIDVMQSLMQQFRGLLC